MRATTKTPDRSLLRRPESPIRPLLRAAAKLILIAAFIVLTNVGFGQRVSLLLDTGRYDTLIPYIAIWGLAVVAVAVAGFQPNHWLRSFWALTISASSAAAWGYYNASQSEFNVFDVVSLWNARHEAGRAVEFYGTHMAMASLVLAVGVFLLVLPVGVNGPFRRWIVRLCWLPALPIAMIAGIVIIKSGGGSQAMPWQFAPVALGSLAGAKIALQGTPERSGVTWQPETSGKRPNIVLLIDESIRADYIDLAPGNPHTPRLAGLAGKFVNFGPAVSGGNCSNYSNVLLRYGASRKDVTRTVNTNASIWEYARKAGYRTVFIDAQAGGITNPGLMQNFMTLAEKAAIDAFHAIRDVTSAAADERLADIVASELAAPGPVFIYANKNGAHFPYDAAYPAGETRYRPTITEKGAHDPAARVASYRNAVSWSVDRFMEKLFGEADLSDTILVYTSDHGQNLDPKGLGHCQVDNPHPRTALVPLMVSTGDAVLRLELERGAERLKGKASHFQIIPSVLTWLGYRADDIATLYDESLTLGTAREPALTTGDVFGMFAGGVRWSPVDPGGDYMEPEGRMLLPDQASANLGGS